MLHKRRNKIKKIVPKKGEQTSLCSNNTIFCSPFLGPASDEELIDYLANLLIEIFIEEGECFDEQKSSDLLPSINERAS